MLHALRRPLRSSCICQAGGRRPMQTRAFPSRSILRQIPCSPLGFCAAARLFHFLRLLVFYAHFFRISLAALRVLPWHFGVAGRLCLYFQQSSFVIPANGPVSGRALVNGFFNCKTACIKFGLTISRQKSETVILLIPHKMSALIFRCFSRATSGVAGCPTASAESISYPAGSASFANVSLFACIAKLFQQNRILYHSQVRGLRVTRRNRRVLRRFNHFCKILFRNFLIRIAAHGSTQMQYLFKFYVDDAPGLFCLCAIGVITQASPILPQWRSPGIAKTPEKREFGKQSDLISWRTVALFLQL